VVKVHQEYATSSNYGFNLTLPPNSITHLVLAIKTPTTKLCPLSLFDEQRAKGIANSKLTEIMKPYWELKKKAAELERRSRAEKDMLSNLDKEQARARSNLNAIQEKDKHQRYLQQIDQIEDKITSTNKTLQTVLDEIGQVSREVVSLEDILVHEDTFVRE